MREATEILDPRERAARLPCWSGAVDPQPLAGGITNRNFLVEDGGRRYVVRIGEDIPWHQVMRFNELAASRAAAAAGLSPEVVYHRPGALVLQYLEARSLTPEEVRQPAMLERILPLIRRCHRELPRYLRGPALIFWVFHVLRDYGHSLEEGGSPYRAQLHDLLARAARLEQAVGAIELVYGHNDLLAANLMDDGKRLWLIDWDYAGFNAPLFDLGGLASNNELAPSAEEWLLEHYFERPLDEALMRRYTAMKCASLLRETLWSMVSELHSEIDFDFAAYTRQNLARFENAWRAFEEM